MSFLVRAACSCIRPRCPDAIGIGDLGPRAFEFIDLLAAAGQRLWQVLPLGPTGYGDSPYQCFSAFAGNPLLISLERLVDDGLLDARPTSATPRRFAPGDHRLPCRDRAPPRALAARARALRGVGARRRARAVRSLLPRHAGWLDDFALFMAVKDAHDRRPWTTWEPDIARREPAGGRALDEALRARDPACTS